ncbi:MAG: hypothetical protein LBU65_11155, partial [Planctomycetaceae bacterium]|nr:hypothetical protein [Planctomycetaceae bacterium]
RGARKKFVGILAGYSIDNPTGHCRKKWDGYTKPTKNLHTRLHTLQNRSIDKRPNLYYSVYYCRGFFPLFNLH